MATRVIYGAEVDQTKGNPSNIRYDVIGANSTQFSVGDPVAVSSGKLIVGSAAAEATSLVIYGVAVKDQTLTSTNATVAKVYPGFVPAEDTVFLMGTNSDLTGNATDVGKFYALTGTTGAIQVDTTFGVTTAASRVVEIVKVDPFNEGGTGVGSGLRQVLIRFVKTPYTNINITP